MSSNVACQRPGNPQFSLTLHINCTQDSLTGNILRKVEVVYLGFEIHPKNSETDEYESDS